MHKVAYNYYLNIKDFFENKYLNANISTKLFLTLDKYNFFVPYYMIMIADKVQDFTCVVKMYEIVFTKKQRMFEEWYIKNLLYNLQFFLQYVPKDNRQFIPLVNEYFKFVYENGIKLHNFDFLSNPEYKNAGIMMDNYIIKEVTNKTQKYSKNECANSKNILIYTGFSDIDWNYTYMQNNALGGSEKAVAYLSKCFPTDYNIFISGHVKNETIDNIQYIHFNELTNLIERTPFHTVIVSRYIGFYEMFKTCSFYQSFVWAHDTLLLPYGCNLNVTHILKKWNNYIDGCVCLTEWHKTIFSEKYPELKNKITLINNGLDLTSFPNVDSDNILKNNKIKNKFIYSSRPDRGLNILLKLWPQIIEKIPDATLTISTYGSFPSNAEEVAMKTLIDSTPSIHYLGKLNVEQLYNEMSSAEFWLYPTHWQETSCITALEMLMSEVICLYYPVAGLVNTVGDYGIQIKPGSEIDAIVSLTDLKKCELRQNGREYAETCSWSNRYELWNKLLSQNQNTNFDNNIKDRIYELHNISFIPKNHIDFLKKLSIDFTPKIIYDIGSNVLAWTREAKKIWPTSEIIAFDAIENIEFLYKEHNIKYHIGVLSKEDNSVVRFYENNIHPAGNSYYKEIGHSKSNELYPENVYVEKKTHTLSSVVKKRKFLLPDLIKIDVQGAELDIIMGGLDVINAAKYLIVELQDTQYNKGAPLADTTIQFLENNRWELVAPKFCDNGPDADYCFKNMSYDSNIKWAFLIPSWYINGLLNDYFDNLKTQYNLIYTKEPEDLKSFNPTKVTFVYEFNDTMLNYCKNNNIEVSLLNTEPLTISHRLQQTLYNCNKINNVKIYDYSKSNIKILNENGFINTEHLPYIITKEENTFLKELNDTTEKIYDFAIISLDNPISCIRRENVVKFLMENGYTVHIIGNLWKKERDVELAKCRIVLNIHGQYINTPSNIFEHLRCDRLLNAGFKILSEDSYCLDLLYTEKYKNYLQIIKYDDFLNINTYNNLEWLKLGNNNFCKLVKTDYLLSLNKDNDILQMKIFIIHYKKLTERKQSILSQFKKYNISNYEFIEIDRDELHEHNTDIFDKNFGNALTAISLSHYFAYKQIIEKYDNAIIFEDDVILHDDFINILKKYFIELPSDYDALFIGNGCNLHVAPCNLCENKHIYKRPLYYKEGILADNGLTRCADSYIISKKCCIKLYDYINNLQNKINESIDAWLEIALMKNNCNVYWAEPTIVTQGSQNGEFDRSWYVLDNNNGKLQNFIKYLQKNENSTFLTNIIIKDVSKISESLRFYYGTNEHQIDVTSNVIEKCIIDNEIFIPGHCNERAALFTDPLFGVIKNVYVVNNNKYCILSDNTYTCINISNKNNSYCRDSIEPNLLTCYKCPYEKIRVGKDFDGGYVICNIPDVKYDFLLSCGVADDISFEEEFCNIYTNAQCTAYD